jgi:hypothetical protein
VRSRTRLEQYDVSQLQQCVGILLCLEYRLKAEPAATEADLLSQVQMAKEANQTVLNIIKGNGD